MKLEDLPKQEHQGVSDGFFASQAETILKKTIEIEKWSLPGTKNVETYFMVPDGYWLSMEEGIRNQISGPQKSLVPEKSFAWKPALAMAFSLVFLLTFSWFWFFNLENQTENWKAQLDKVSDKELLAYVESRPNPEIQEITEHLASKVLNESDMVAPDLKISEEDLDESLDQITDQDILQNIDTL